MQRDARAAASRHALDTLAPGRPHALWLGEQQRAHYARGDVRDRVLEALQHLLRQRLAVDALQQVALQDLREAGGQGKF